MCFSATASFTAGSILLVTGAFTLRQVKHLSSIPFASIPLIFGIQQIIEGMVWLSFNSSISNPMFHSIVVYMFVFIAYVFWPIYVPISILFLEKDLFRRKILWVISFIGVIAGMYLFFYILLGPLISSIVSKSIYYEITVPYSFTSFFLYFIAVCGGCIFSSSKKINIFGTAILVSFFIAHTFYFKTLFSVWCFFAALLSITIFFHIKDLNKLYKEREK